MEHHHNFLLYTVDQAHALVGVAQKIIVDKNRITSAEFKKLAGLASVQMAGIKVSIC